LRTSSLVGTSSQMKIIDAEVLAQIGLEDVSRVTFFKRDEITKDLICCEVLVDGETWTFYEELNGWDLLIRHLEALPDFDRNWFAAVSQPPFNASTTVAFVRR